jgi:hypothetical protein
MTFLRHPLALSLIAGVLVCTVALALALDEAHATVNGVLCVRS